MGVRVEELMKCVKQMGPKIGGNGLRQTPFSHYHGSVNIFN